MIMHFTLLLSIALNMLVIETFFELWPNLVSTVEYVYIIGSQNIGVSFVPS